MAGATQALTTAILCCVHPVDEVIVIEPAYDSYLPVGLCGVLMMIRRVLGLTAAASWSHGTL